STTPSSSTRRPWLSMAKLCTSFIAARNAVSAMPAAPGHAICFLASGPRLMDEPSIVAAPVYWLQPANPLTLSASSKASVGGASAVTSASPILTSGHHVPSRPPLGVALAPPRPPHADRTPARTTRGSRRFMDGSIAPDPLFVAGAVHEYNLRPYDHHRTLHLDHQGRPGPHAQRRRDHGRRHCRPGQGCRRGGGGGRDAGGRGGARTSRTR